MSFLCPRPTVRDQCLPIQGSAEGGEVVLRKPEAGFTVSSHSLKRNSGKEIAHTHTHTGMGIRGRAGSTSVKGDSHFLPWKVTRKEEELGQACPGLL